MCSDKNVTYVSGCTSAHHRHANKLPIAAVAVAVAVKDHVNVGR